MKKRLLSVLLLLGLLLLLSSCAAHNVDVPALEFGGTEGDVSVLRLYFDGDSPVFLENGAFVTKVTSYAITMTLSTI